MLSFSWAYSARFLLVLYPAKGLYEHKDKETIPTIMSHTLTWACRNGIRGDDCFRQHMNHTTRAQGSGLVDSAQEVPEKHERFAATCRDMCVLSCQEQFCVEVRAHV